MAAADPHAHAAKADIADVHMEWEGDRVVRRQVRENKCLFRSEKEHRGCAPCERQICQCQLWCPFTVGPSDGWWTWGVSHGVHSCPGTRDTEINLLDLCFVCELWGVVRYWFEHMFYKPLFQVLTSYTDKFQPFPIPHLGLPSWEFPWQSPLRRRGFKLMPG